MYHAFYSMGVQLIYKYSVIVVNKGLNGTFQIIAEVEGFVVEVDFDVHNL
jgi:hypothetical protein